MNASKINATIYLFNKKNYKKVVICCSPDRGLRGLWTCEAVKLWVECRGKDSGQEMTECCKRGLVNCVCYRY